MARLAAVVAPLCLAAFCLASAANAQSSTPVIRARVVVDADDDDADGVPDSQANEGVDTTDAAVVDRSLVRQGLVVQQIRPAGAVRVLVDGAPVVSATRIPRSARTVALQALRPGRAHVDLGLVHVQLDAVAIVAVDATGEVVDMARSHASSQRTPPEALDSALQPSSDPDALRYVVAASAGQMPSHVRIISRSEAGDVVDAVQRAPLVAAACPLHYPEPIACATTWPMRVVADAIDRGHPVVRDRSIQGELGGGLIIELSQEQAQQIRIGGPRHTRLGPIDRYRARLAVSTVRMARGGAPSIAPDDEQAQAMVAELVAGANALWAQCGISFGPPSRVALRVRDPLPPFQLAVGCEVGLPASGGLIRVLVDGRELNVRTEPGQSPAQVARRLASALRTRGLLARESRNPRILAGAFPTVDVLVLHQDGTPARLSTPGGAASTDATMGVCLTGIHPWRGLRHFIDVDAMAGTLEERALLKWLEDGDRGTLDVVLVPGFAGSGRIGESFIGVGSEALGAVVLLDGAGIRGSGWAHTLAHELGHVLLGVPGHPDNYGLDTPTLLMDSDAASASPFGPRRLTLDDCERALLQSGPQAPVALLERWPWGKLPKPVRKMELRQGR